MKMNTADLLNELRGFSDIGEFLKKYDNEFIGITVSDCLSDMLAVKEMSISEVSADSGVGEYVYKIFSGERKPSRDVLIAIAFGMRLSFEETQLVLRIAKLAALDVRNRRDSVIIHAIMNGKTVFDTDDILSSGNLATIG